MGGLALSMKLEIFAKLIRFFVFYLSLRGKIPKGAGISAHSEFAKNQSLNAT
jgi:hypothetical protein